MAIYTDSATALVDVTPSGSDLFVGSDSATVLIDLSTSGTETHTKPDFAGEGVAFNRFTHFDLEARFSFDEDFAFNTRFNGVLRAGGLDA